MYQTRSNPLDAAFNPVATGGQGVPVEPFTDPNVDGQKWCEGCHLSGMTSTPCQGCHNHADSRF